MELWSMVALTAKYREDPSFVALTLEMLENQIVAMHKSIENSDQMGLAQADYDFHFTIIDSGNNALFSSIYQVLRSFMYEEIEKSHEDFTDITTIIDEHQVIIEAIKSGDVHCAQDEVLNHIASIKRRLANVMNNL
jgi:DNA-binding GntR family transcriptional regulator